MGREDEKNETTNVNLTINLNWPAALSLLGELLQRVKNLQAAQSAEWEQVMATLDELASEIQDESTVDDSIVALLDGIKAQLDAAKGDQTKIDAIFAKAVENKAKLAAALLANTPADPSV